MTLRRLLVLINALPPDSLTWLTIAAEHKRMLTGPERQRERRAYYERKAQRD